MTLVRKSLVWWLFGLRALVAVLHAFRPITSPHVWRQVDTLAVAFRYWQRWSLGPAEALRALLPAVLNGGDAVGLTPMEFPLLNLAGAPAFALGIDAGRVAAHLICLAIIVGLIVLNLRIWRGRLVAGVAAETWLLLLPCFSFAADFFAKFMPDLPATLLVLAGVGLVWEGRGRPIAAALAVATGALIKPTATGVVLLLLLCPDRPVGLVRRMVPLTVGTAIAFAYYTVGIRYLQVFQDVIPHFAVAPRSPLAALAEFFSEPTAFVNLLNDHAFVPWALALVLGSLVLLKTRLTRNAWMILACVVLQMLFLAALSGKHVYVHSYYFMALAPTLALLALSLVQSWSSKWLTAAFWLLVICHLGEMSFIELGGYLQSDSNAALFAECAKLRQAEPDFGWGRNLPFRSSQENYPLLGFCFGEREDSATAARGFYYVKDGVPAGCRSLRAGARVALAICDGAS